jgi:hypothetical protein
MNKEECIKLGIDYDQGVGRFMGNTALYEKYALKFLDDKTFDELRTAMKASDTQQAFYAAHTLKGVAGNLSFNLFLDKVIPLVEALRGGDQAKADELYPIVAAEYERLIAGLEAQK